MRRTNWAFYLLKNGHCFGFLLYQRLWLVLQYWKWLKMLKFQQDSKLDNFTRRLSDLQYAACKLKARLNLQYPKPDQRKKLDGISDSVLVNSQHKTQPGPDEPRLEAVERNCLHQLQLESTFTLTHLKSKLVSTWKARSDNCNTNQARRRCRATVMALHAHENKFCFRGDTSWVEGMNYFNNPEVIREDETAALLPPHYDTPSCQSLWMCSVMW